MATGLGEADEAAACEAAGEDATLGRTVGDGLDDTLSGEGLAAGFAEAGTLAVVGAVGFDAVGGAGGAWQAVRRRARSGPAKVDKGQAFERGMWRFLQSAGRWAPQGGGPFG
jgi:hypothetical protein